MEAVVYKIFISVKNNGFWSYFVSLASYAKKLDFQGLFLSLLLYALASDLIDFYMKKTMCLKSFVL